MIQFAEIFFGFDQTTAEVTHPDAVHFNARREWIARIDQPASHPETQRSQPAGDQISGVGIDGDWFFGRHFGARGSQAGDKTLARADCHMVFETCCVHLGQQRRQILSGGFLGQVNAGRPADWAIFQTMLGTVMFWIGVVSLMSAIIIAAYGGFG